MTDVPYEIVCRVDDVGEQEWLKLRQLGIGASEAPAIIGEHRWLSAYKLYQQKVGNLVDDELNAREDVLWGKRLERLIIDVYRERSGRFADYGGLLLRSKRYPWALCTLDGWTSTLELGPYWSLEIKTANEFKADEWVHGAPSQYNVQGHWQMLVLDTERTTIACLIGGQKLVWCDVERDETLMRKLVHHGEQFWERVERRDPPDVDGSDATAKALRRMFPEDNGERIELPAVMLDDVETFLGIKQRIGALEEERDAIDARIREAMGPNALGFFAGSDVTISLKTERRSSYTVAPSVRRTLRIKQPKVKGARK